MMVMLCGVADAHRASEGTARVAAGARASMLLEAITGAVHPCLASLLVPPPGQIRSIMMVTIGGPAGGALMEQVEVLHYDAKTDTATVRAPWTYGSALWAAMACTTTTTTTTTGSARGAVGCRLEVAHASPFLAALGRLIPPLLDDFADVLNPPLAGADGVDDEMGTS